MVNFFADFPIYFLKYFISIFGIQNALVSGDALPESKNDFERLVIAQPNSSYVWIQYMTFYLQTADSAAARGIAERALRTVNFREEDVSVLHLS